MTIVVGYSPTPQSEAALAAALREAEAHRQDLLLVNSSTGDRYADTSFATEEQLATVRTTLDAAAVAYEIRQPVRGRSVSDEIVDAAKESGAEMIVIGMRHRTPVGKLIMGSTAQQILLEAPCPVLAVKP